MKLSVVIPVHNEEECIEKVVGNLILELESNAIDREIILVNDNSTDASAEILHKLVNSDRRIKIIDSPPPKGFGRAIRKGLDAVSGDVAVIFMGDGSDDAADVVKYYHKILEGYDCVFGSRFIKGSRAEAYPKIKLLLNRLGNKLIQLLFFIK